MDPVMAPSNGQLVINVLEDGNDDLWIYDFNQSTPQRLTFSDDGDFQPAWSPDGKWLAYDRDDSTGSGELYVLAVDSQDEPQALGLHRSGRVMGAPNWSPDGRHILFHLDDGGSTGRDLYYVTLRQTQGSPAPVGPPVAIPRPGNDFYPILSPNGQYVAYMSDRSGNFEVYVRPFPGGRGEWKVSVGGGTHARWNGQGDELFYAAPDSNMMMVVKVDTRSNRFGHESPQQLFSLEQTELHSAVGSSRSYYDVTPDGQRFVMIRGNQSSTKGKLTVVQNWRRNR
jgi:eukaryotic-like serine/threonine-protein kinase